MGLRAKSRKRLVVLVASVVGVAVIGGGAYTLRKMQIARNIEKLRPIGMDAYKNGDWVAAFNYLGPYLQKHENDAEVLKAYADVREKLAEPNGGNLKEAEGYYRRLVALRPENLEDRRELNMLFMALGQYTELNQGADDLIRQLGREILRGQANLPEGPDMNAYLGRVIAALKSRISDGAAASGGEDLRKKYVEPLFEAMQLKASALAFLQKAPDAYKIVDQLQVLDPDNAGSGRSLLQVMTSNSEPQATIISRMQAWFKGREKDPRAMLVMALMYRAQNDLKSGQPLALEASRHDVSSDAAAVDLARMLDQLEMFHDPQDGESPGMRVVKNALTKFPTDGLREEYFCRLVYQQKFDQAATEISQLKDVHRASFIGLEIIALCQRARELTDAGDKDAAAKAKGRAKDLMQTLEECGKKWDTTADNWRDVLQLLYFTDKVDEREFIAKCRTAVSVQPANPFFLLFLGDAYRNAGDSEQAVQEWQYASQYAISWATPLTRMAQYATARGDPSHALALARRADARLASQKETLDAIVASWYDSLRQRGNVTNQDRRELLSYIESNDSLIGMDEDVLPRELFLRVELSNNNKKDAEEWVKKVLASVSGDQAGSLLRLSMAVQGAGFDQSLVDQVISTYEKLKGVTPDSASYRCRLQLDRAAKAEASGNKGAMDEARKAVRASLDAWRKKAFEKSDADHARWDLAFTSLLEITQDPGALASWRDLVDRYPNSEEVQNLATASPAVWTDHGLTGKVLDHLARLNGDTGLTWRLQKCRWLLADTAQPRESIDEALKLLNEAISFSPNAADAILMRAQAFELSNRIPEAIRDFARAADLQPQNLEVKLELAKLYLLPSQNESVRAAEQLNRVVNASNVTDQQRTRAGVMLAQAGEVDASLGALTAKESTDPDIKLLVAGEYWRKGDWEAAAKRYTALLDNPIHASGKPAPEFADSALQFYGAMNENWAQAADAATHRSQVDTLAKMKSEGSVRALDVLDKMSVDEGQKHAIRGAYFLRQNKYDQAIAEFAAGTKLAPGDGFPWRRLLIAQLSAGKPQDAVATVHSAGAVLSADPACRALVSLGEGPAKFILTSPDVLNYFSACLFNTSQAHGIEEVAGVLQHASANAADNRAIAQQVRGIADSNRDSLALQVLAIQYLLSTNQLEDGVALARRALVDYQGSGELAYLATMGLVNLHRWEEVSSFANRWKTSVGSPDSLQPDIVLAASDVYTNRPAEAAALMQKALLTLKPDDRNYREVVNILATALVHQQQFAKAEQLLWPEVQRDKAWREDWTRIATDEIALRDTNGVANFNVASAWLKKLTDATAKDDFEGQIIIGVAWYSLGDKAQDADARQQGYGIMRAAVDTIPTDPRSKARALLALGQTAEQLGDPERAKDNYRQALKLSDTFKPEEQLHQAANNLAVVMVLSHDDLNQAEKYARQAIALQPDSRYTPSYYDTLAFVLRAEKQYDAALTAIGESIKRDSHNVEWLISETEIFIAANRNDKAREIVQHIDPDTPELATTLKKRWDAINFTLGTNKPAGNAVGKVGP